MKKIYIVRLTDEERETCLASHMTIQKTLKKQNNRTKNAVLGQEASTVHPSRAANSLRE